jgi:predicted sulfurtransferase
MLQKAGLKNTYQLDGGVVKYINTYNDGNWKGNLYVFDDRVSCEVGDENTHETIGVCLYSDKLTDNCENCRYSPCNARIIADKAEYKKHYGFCSEECYLQALETGLIKDVDFDKLNYRQLRVKMKNHPETRSEVLALIKKHITSNIENTQFKHKTSQKEDFIMD